MKNKLKIILLIIILASIILYIYNIGYYKIFITKNNELVINLLKNGMYCQLAENKLTDNWIRAEKKQCKFKLDENNFKLYIKDKKGKIKQIKNADKLGKVISADLNTNKIYLALNELYTPYLNIKTIGNVNKELKWTSSNSEIIESKGSRIYAKKIGKAKIKTRFKGNTYKMEVEVVDNIFPTNNKYDKKYLSCNLYSKQDNDLLDEILKQRINNVGYQTRAGIVEAARFLTLNFPYRINYFYENGRATPFNTKTLVYGEGRYYHKGLYLHESRYRNILTSVNGPSIWGCDLYSNIEKITTSNGLNCSGFIAWVFLNAGYDPGDIGAGITTVTDFTDLGKKEELTKEIIHSQKIKAGDLLYSSQVGGHIAIIVGIDKENYYVAEAYWEKPRGVVINTYNKKDISNNFSLVMLMDEYYKNEGNYTEIWY